ncbi:hypothetical protein C8R43DRAFT_1048526 [Mycena crocata]|nr:hypothetical protein C8R43DRAFT_1048526 [Mycena crocata]
MTFRTALQVLVAQHQLATRLRSQGPDSSNKLRPISKQVPSLLPVEGTTESLKLPMPPFNMFKYIKSTSRAQTLNSRHRGPVFTVTFPSIHLKYVLVKILPQILDVQCVSIHQAAGHDQTDGRYVTPLLNAFDTACIPHMSSYLQRCSDRATGEGICPLVVSSLPIAHQGVFLRAGVYDSTKISRIAHALLNYLSFCARYVAAIRWRSIYPDPNASI